MTAETVRDAAQEGMVPGAPDDVPFKYCPLLSRLPRGQRNSARARETMALLLTRDEIRTLLDDPSQLDAAFAAIESAFREHRETDGKATPQLALPLQDGRGAVRVVTAASAANGVTVRASSGGPGASAIDAYMIMLFDSENGQLLAVMAGDDLNVYRTEVPAGVGCRLLARPGSTTVGMLGSGRQARGQLIMLRHALPGLARVRVYSPTPEHRVAFALEMSERLGMHVEAVSDPRSAVTDADVVGVTSNATAPVLEASWLKPGALVISIAVGQLPADLVPAARVVVSSLADVVGPGTRREPYRSLIARGAWDLERAVELVDVIAGATPGRTRDDEIIVYELAGMGAWDTAIFRWVYRWATEHGVGTPFHLSSSAPTA
jgi:ornithine cyclodeaminase/alanine dehydrogenase-like protein (mu-crystallin family)